MGSTGYAEKTIIFRGASMKNLKKKVHFRIKLKSKHLLVIMSIFCVSCIAATFSSGVTTAPLQDTAGILIVPFENSINRIIRLNLHSKGNFLFIKCENSCNEDNLRITNGKYKSSKKNSDKHGYGLKIINGIAEKYNGILNVQVRGGFFAVTTTLCLDENND